MLPLIRRHPLKAQTPLSMKPQHTAWSMWNKTKMALLGYLALSHKRRPWQAKEHDVKLMTDTQQMIRT